MRNHYEETKIETSDSGIHTVYGRNHGETWTMICRTSNQTFAEEVADTRLGDPSKNTYMLTLTGQDMADLKSVLEDAERFFREGTIGERARRLLTKIGT